MAASRKKTDRPSAAAEEMQRLLAQHIPKVVDVLLQIMHDEGQKPELRMKAAESILDRACGKASAAQSADMSNAPPISISFEGVLEEWSR